MIKMMMKWMMMMMTRMMNKRAMWRPLGVTVGLVPLILVRLKPKLCHTLTHTRHTRHTGTLLGRF